MSDGRILIADDEPSVRDAVGYALQQEGFDVTLAEDGDDADAKLGNDAPGFDLLILDIMMPGRSGLDICRDVRARSPVPIILLTAKDAEVDKVVGLEVGADDYVTKPFSVRELLGRVRAQLRRRELDRTSSGREGKTIEAGPVRIDLARHLVTIRGEPVNLTRSEFQVLRLLAERPGSGVQPPRDHGGAVAVGVLGRRARLRRPHLQPAPEDRARPPGPEARAHRSRRRLPVGRGAGRRQRPEGRESRRRDSNP